MLLQERGFSFVAEKTGGHGHGPAGIQDVDDWLAVMWRNLNGGMRAARGCPSNQQRQLEALTLHLAGHMHHLVERWSDQPAESDHVSLFRLGAFEDLFAGAHPSHVDHLIVVAGKHDTDDVLAYIVNIALDCREYDFSLRLDLFPRRSSRFLLGFHVGS